MAKADFSHEGATRARRALAQVFDEMTDSIRLTHKKHFEMIDAFLKEAQRIAPFENKEPEEVKPEKPA